MAIIFSEQQKKQRYFILLLALVLVFTALVVWFGFFRRPGAEHLSLPFSRYAKKIEIDFSILTRPRLKGLDLFRAVEPFSASAGRDNPFLPAPPATPSPSVSPSP